jgi:hypothetical protein
VVIFEPLIEVLQNALINEEFFGAASLILQFFGSARNGRLHGRFGDLPLISLGVPSEV